MSSPAGPRFILLLLLLPAPLHAQFVRGQVFGTGHRPLQGALVEVHDSADRPVQSVLTSPSGAWQVIVPAPGHYRYRVAAIGYQPQPYTMINVPMEGVIATDVVLVATAIRLPDLIALERNRYCGKKSLSDDLFGRVLESAHTALQIIEKTIETHQLMFEVAVINSRTLYGSVLNYVVADTVVQPLASWPVASINPDTLRAVGFSRTLVSGDEGTREYYGPDARVLFADWFLDSHCYTLDKPKKKGNNDTLTVRFAPAHKSRRTDVAGQLLLDAHDLSLLQFSFTLTNLPGWMPEDASGGNMQFSRLASGLWMTRNWAIWAPIAAVSRSRHLGVGGVQESYGWVVKVTPSDSVGSAPPAL
ncbi:MAG: carboxypeptidase-like regulatory domain-containing protein [Gemmatimonadales bacterium]